ncbi:sensor histidine kinase [Kitasatospora sp. NPDC091207]|uniref:sensor histidine kinase n=1 Tax=Kitasatospora sp. NPDC091207 TaxID=3364083 RepID=UPI0038130EA2
MAVLGVVAPVLLAHPGEHAAALLVAVTAALAVASAILPWPVGRVALAGAAAAAAVASLALDAAYSGPYRLPAFWLPVEWSALLVLLGRATRRVRGRWAGPVGAVAGLAVLLVPLRFTLRVPDAGWTGSLVAVLFSVLPVAGVAGAGLYLRALDTRREGAVIGARREQRLEVARGLHDFVAHEITGIVLEAQAGQLPGAGPEETAALLRRLEEAGLRALDSMDAMVGALRDPQVDETGQGRAVGATRMHGLADLPELVGRFTTTGTTRATLDSAPDTAGLLSPEGEATGYAVVLEALTNVRRHAPGAAAVVVRVAIGPDGRSVELSVTDDGGRGRGPKGLRRRRQGSGGTGLAGLAERVAAQGGALDAGPYRPPGWRTRCVLPVR